MGEIGEGGKWEWDLARRSPHSYYLLDDRRHDEPTVSVCGLSSVLHGPSRLGPAYFYLGIYTSILISLYIFSHNIITDIYQVVKKNVLPSRTKVA